MSELPSRFVMLGYQELPAELRRALLGEFATRQGYDTADTSSAGSEGWVDHLEQQLKSGELTVIHDLDTETTEVMTRQQYHSFVAHIHSQDDGLS